MIRHESKLNADIRVAILPPGLDPDEIVLSSPGQWREVIAGARPVVEHVIDSLLSTFNIADPRGKSDAVKAIAPILKDLSDPVQRDIYVQQIARRLQLNARAVAEVMGVAWTTRQAVRQSAAPEAVPEPEAPPSDSGSAHPRMARGAGRGVDLELHLVTILVRRPDLLMDANVALTRANLEVLSGEDFMNPALRAGFNQLSRAATGQALSEADDDWLALIADYQLTNDDETFLREEATRTALRLRMENLLRERTALAYMVDDAKNAGDPAQVAQYNLRLRDVAAKHFRVQKALRLRGMLVIS